ncbi:MAG: site-specific DNA-methyltransferase [Bacteroidetes bacterium]|jgi:adenine-specific DNA-methyltransferase|nr:site-specific DNA-methyltransferase [Bacteroidota bacterium]
MATPSKKDVETITHDDATRRNIPTAEYQPLVRYEDAAPVQVAYKRRNPDQDPQLVWRGKDVQDWADLIVDASPLYIQEKVHPKVLIDDLVRRTEEREEEEADTGQADLFDDFNGVPDGEAKTEFYEHDANWSNRMILGDALQVMGSLAEREGLRGQVQCIYLDPPYGIKFNSNFQWSTTTRNVRDGKADHITREPEQVKAFRDTWRDGIHSYLTYLRDRLTVCRDLLKDSGSIFVQIGDENVHRVRALMDEVFGDDCHISLIAFSKGATGLSASGRMPSRLDYILWYARSSDTTTKYRQLYSLKEADDSGFNWIVRSDGSAIRRTRVEDESEASFARYGQDVSLTKPGPGSKYEVEFEGEVFDPGKRWWGTTKEQMERALRSGRVIRVGNSIRHLRYLDESSLTAIGNLWDGFLGQSSPVYVVQTNTDIVKRCLLMATDPGDLILDPTCGSGTTAHVAEKWGRRWITIDTSRVALALARARLMGARYPYYLLKDSSEGQKKEAEIRREPVRDSSTSNDVRQGFVYERVPKVTFKTISNNSEIDVIYEEFEEQMAPLREEINERAGLDLEAWQMHREPGDPWPEAAQEQHARFERVTTDATRQKAVNRVNEIMGRDYTIDTFPSTPVDPWEDEKLHDLHERWWELRIERQEEIDASIAAAADFEYLYDQPYEDKSKVRVAGPFTVESLAPHRTLGVDANGEVMDPAAEAREPVGGQDFPSLILDALRKAGVQQAHKEDRIEFDSLTVWPGEYVCAVGTYTEAETGEEQRAGIFIGPEFGSVGRDDLAAAAREAADAGLDALVACAFSFEPHASDFDKLGRVRVLRARMNADLHMAEDLANTGSGNLFVIFGEPDIDIHQAAPEEEDDDRLQVQINGVDVFDPSSGEVRSDDTDGIACWFIDTDYNEESFFVRHAYFLGAGDPYDSLKTTLKAEIDQEAWDSLYSDTSRPFAPPASGRIAVKVINHLGDEVMQVFQVG